MYHNSPHCSFAIASPKLLDEFATAQKIPWREEWGKRSLPYIGFDIALMTLEEVLSSAGFASALDCVAQGGQAGHQATTGEYPAFFSGTGLDMKTVV